jgi:hypothetical protein
MDHPRFYIFFILATFVIMTISKPYHRESAENDLNYDVDGMIFIILKNSF